MTHNAFVQGQIRAPVVGVFFEPSTSIGAQNGEVTFGGVDPDKFNGPIHYTYVSPHR